MFIAAGGNLSPTGETNQTIAALDSLGPAKLHGIDPATGTKRRETVEMFHSML